MGIKVGIDLGTTFSAVAIMDEKKGQPIIVPNTNGERITPSVIQFLPNGEIVVGTEAKDAYEAGESGCVSAFKRSMGKTEPYCSFYGKSYTAEALSSILLRYLKEEAEAVTGQKIDEAVVTVPAYFYHKERSATMRAAKAAGLNIRQIINEPTAAAMNYGANHWRENARVLVYDLGGGTFDVTLVQMKKNNRMESLQTTGNHTLGGKDWDSRLCGIIENKIEADTGCSVEEYPEIHKEVQQIAERTKRQLSSRTSINISLQLPAYGKYTTTVTRDEFEQVTLDLIERTGSLCNSLLHGLGFGWSDVTDILLVGGSTRMPQVAAYLKRISGHVPLSQVNPDEAVALGAAVQVHLPLPSYTVITTADPNEEQPTTGNFLFRRSSNRGLRQEQPKQGALGIVGKETQLTNALSMSPVDVVAHAMGIIAVNKEGTHYINKTIVPANQQIPVKCAESFHYYTSSSGDNELEIYVLQGTRPPLQSEIIGKYVVTGIRHNREDNPTTIKIQYSYDINGMIHVQARQNDGTQDLPIREEPVPPDMSKFGRPIDPSEMHSAAEDLNVVMAIDVSGSMSGTPIEDARNAMCHFVDQFENYPGKVNIGVVAVSDRSEIVQHLTGDLLKCKKTIRSITECMTGICNDGHPFSDIKSMLKNASGKCIGIILADGMWNNQGAAVSAAKECHRNGIDITGIGFGSADKKFLHDISSGDINSMLVQQSELTQSFGKIAQEIGGGKPGKHGSDNKARSAATWVAIGE